MTIRTEGDRSVLPPNRRLSLRFPNIVSHHPADELLAPQTGDVTVTVEQNGQNTAFEANTYAEAAVTLTEYDPAATYTVRVTVPAVDILTEKKREVIAKLQKTQATFSVRRKVAEKVQTAENIDCLQGRILLSDLGEPEKKRLCETLFPDETT